MKRIFAILFCLFSTVALADETVRFKDGFTATISKAVRTTPDFAYPKEVYKMTPEEFANWATEQNQRAREEAFREYVHGSENLTADITVTDFEGKWVADGYGYAIPRSGGQIVTRKYQHSYRNPNYQAPGPLMIINPYCQPKK